MRMVNLAIMKTGLRQFLKRKTSVVATMNWDSGKSAITVDCGPRGVNFTFEPDSLNSEGDPLTDENKQDIVDTLQAIVDEHNTQVE